MQSGDTEARLAIAPVPPGWDGVAERADQLTGLMDRAGFLRLLEAQVQAALAGQAAPPVLLIDLDRFKAVNDAYGHPAGDALLRIAARRIRGAVRRGEAPGGSPGGSSSEQPGEAERPVDAVGRLGGDEFAVLLRPPVALDQAMAVGQRLVELLSRQFLVEGNVAQVGASVGVAEMAAGASTGLDLIRQADLALYAAKRQGRGRVALFDPALQKAAETRTGLELELRAALPLGQFELHYQPLLGLAGNRIEGFEALLRWRHPSRGLLGPGEFLQRADEIGLLPGIGAWVLRVACAAAVGWAGHLTIAVNVAPCQLTDPGFAELVGRVLRETGLAPGRLELEVTENALIDAAGGPVTEVLQSLDAMGVRLALDDFGTGYASLSQLRRLPFHRMKIDRSFADDRAMMAAAIGIGHTLGLGTTVEGIEQQSQLDSAQAMGCDVAQGYLISRPLDGAGMARFLAGNSLPQDDEVLP